MPSTKIREKSRGQNTKKEQKLQREIMGRKERSASGFGGKLEELYPSIHFLRACSVELQLIDFECVALRANEAKKTREEIICNKDERKRGTKRKAREPWSRCQSSFLRHEQKQQVYS
jgi:hypothetical protein